MVNDRLKIKDFASCDITHATAMLVQKLKQKVQVKTLNNELLDNKSKSKLSLLKVCSLVNI